MEDLKKKKVSVKDAEQKAINVGLGTINDNSLIFFKLLFEIENIGILFPHLCFL